MATDIAQLHGDGTSQAEIARRLHTGRTSVRHIIAGIKEQ